MEMLLAQKQELDSIRLPAKASGLLIAGRYKEVMGDIHQKLHGALVVENILAVQA